MINKITYYITQQTVPYNNLALEEYLLNTVEEGECILYLWQNRHTVVIGRNQNCWKECKVDKLEEDNGYLARRLSGGGAVYHDLGNLNFTFLVHKSDYDVRRQLQVIIEAVRSFGVEAVQTGRNDIVVDERKFSGNAFYENGDRCYHHGTIMVNVDKDHLPKYLNVSLKKMQSKGVDSVKSRVINLAECNPEITIEAMTGALVKAFGKTYGLEPRMMCEKDLDTKKIEELTRVYSSDAWKYGTSISFTCEMDERYPWGLITLQYAVVDGSISECRVYSDAMDGEFIPRIEKCLTGCAFRTNDMCAQLDTLETSDELKKEMISDTKKLISDNI